MLVLLQSREQKRVDGIADLGLRMADGWHLRPENGLEGPERSLLFGDIVISDRFRLRPSGPGSRVDPCGDDAPFFLTQLFFTGRHLASREPLPQQTLGMFAGDERRARLAPLGDQPGQSQVEFRFWLHVLAVTLKAVRLENRPHMRFKQRRSVRDNRRWTFFRKRRPDAHDQKQRQEQAGSKHGR